MVKISQIPLVEARNEKVRRGVCGPELGRTSAVRVATLLVPHSPDLIPRGH